MICYCLHINSSLSVGRYMDVTIASGSVSFYENINYSRFLVVLRILRLTYQLLIHFCFLLFGVPPKIWQTKLKVWNAEEPHRLLRLLVAWFSDLCRCIWLGELWQSYSSFWLILGENVKKKELGASLYCVCIVFMHRAWNIHCKNFIW